MCTFLSVVGRIKYLFYVFFILSVTTISICAHGGAEGLHPDKRGYGFLAGVMDEVE